MYQGQVDMGWTLSKGSAQESNQLHSPAAEQ